MPTPAAVTVTALAALVGVPAPRGGDVGVIGVSLDSRSVRPGELYAALPGQHAHGASFAADAAAAGAVAVLTDPAGAADAAATGLPVLVVDDPRARLGGVAAAVYGDPGRRLLLLGVTGTNGKTTTAYFLEAGLAAAGHTTGLMGTVVTKVASRVVASVRTTPEAPQVQALLASMVAAGCTAAALEISSHALALGRVDGLVCDVAAFTNLSQDHLDFHATMEDYFAAKASLFTPAHCRRGVVSTDDAAGRRIAAQSPVPVESVSLAGRPADWRAEQLRAGADGCTLLALGPHGIRVDLRVGMPGSFNAANALLALASLVAAGVEPSAAAAGIGAVTGVPGRMERVDVGQPFLALVDYAHTPMAVTALLGEVRQLAAGRVIVVLGCGGDRDRDKRPLMGAAAAAGSDLAVLTSDNPRNEDPDVILAQMLAGTAGSPGTIVVEPDRAIAIATAVAEAGPGDVVVVAGKGHEQGQEVAGQVRPFDDRVVLADALAGWAAR